MCFLIWSRVWPSPSCVCMSVEQELKPAAIDSLSLVVEKKARLHDMLARLMLDAAINGCFVRYLGCSNEILLLRRPR